MIQRAYTPKNIGGDNLAYLDAKNLTEQNFVQYALDNYHNDHIWDYEEFIEDLKKVRYIKRNLNKYAATGEIKDRLVLNQIIILGNLFGPVATTKMLFFKIDREQWPTLKTFLLFINFLPSTIAGVMDKPIRTDEIPLDNTLVGMLRKIKKEGI